MLLLQQIFKYLIWKYCSSSLLETYELLDLMLRTDKKWKQTDTESIKLSCLVWLEDCLTCSELWKLQTQIQQPNSTFIPQVFSKDKLSLCGNNFLGPLWLRLVTQIAFAKQYDEISSGVFSLCRKNQNNYSGSFRHRLYSVNLSKVSKTESNESSCAVHLEPSEASCCVDKAA